MNPKKIKKYAPIVIIMTLVVGVCSFFIFFYTYEDPVMNKPVVSEDDELKDYTSILELFGPMLPIVFIVSALMFVVLFIFPRGD